MYPKATVMNSRFMDIALDLAKESLSEGEIPVGAVVVKDGKIIGTGRNKREQKNLSTSHAEIEAINDACKNTGDWRLDGCEIYVTLEPCLMCTGAILSARIDTVVFGAFDLKSGCVDSAFNINTFPSDSKISVFGGIRETECSALLTEFFKGVRKNATENN